MRPFFLKQLLAATLLAGACSVTAATLTEEYREVSSKGVASYSFSLDNDSLLLNRDDGFYSSGLRVDKEFALARDGGRLVYGWRLGQDLYTPSDIKLPPEQVGPPDHPYAGWLYGGAFREMRNADGTYLRYGVDLGCLGPCAGGRWTQTNLHRIIDQPLPQGWSKQVKNELGVVLMADVAPVRWKLTSGLDLTPGLHARFGNIHTDASGDLTLRFGQLDQVGPSVLHGYLRTDIRLVAYNATLQGGYFSEGNPHTVEPRRTVGEIELGGVWQFGAMGVKAAVVRRGNEIRGLDNSIGAQNFVRLQFSYTP